MLAGNLPVVVTFFAAGSFITSQTASAKFVFDKEDFYLDTTMDDGNARRENPVVGGENRWAYSSFKNWRFFPGRDVLTPIETPLGAVKPFPFLVDPEELAFLFEQKGCAAKEQGK